MNEIGKVYIIGVGPGNPKLITLRAVECIKTADIIVYDRLINKIILKYAKKDAEFTDVGKLPDFHKVAQDEINKIIISNAVNGKIVARIKGGDPFVFGRGGEEVEALIANNIDFEIIPGISSALAVPAYAGIPLTHRDCSSSLHIITGHENPKKKDSLIDYKVLAQLNGTLVFLMGFKNLEIICNRLIDNGKDTKVPVAVIQEGTTNNQKTVVGTLENIVSKVKDANLSSPVIIVVGEVVNFSEKFQWFPKGPLVGKKIIVTRAREQASKLVDAIVNLGGTAIEFPTIKIEQPNDNQKIINTFKNLANYTWIVFTSTNGVNSFFYHLKQNQIDIRSLYHIKIAAIGEETANEIKKFGLLIDFIPKFYTSNDLIYELIKKLMPQDTILLARSDVGNKDILSILNDANIQYDDVSFYKTVIEDSNKDNIIYALKASKLDYITFTSSSTVTNFISIIGKENLNLLKDLKSVCIGPITAKTALDNGIINIEIADVYTVDGIVKKILSLSGDSHEFN